ncbi:Histidine protein methyltransferase 1 [Cytospora mali]|uniref:protein-histidine N-methyltransferase n=1 Tax=Cytospora mali TaxID=578113 RepID=A0A194UZZ4_CYTMA|nr:Histidine protein methyltransferase 1 [Valsa mali var. pyri (nom. inval.)]
MSFSFSFGGDDIEDDTSVPLAAPSAPLPTASASASSAFPVQGKPQLPPVHHDLGQLLSNLPSKIAYSLLDVDLDGKASIQIPRRELWDVRVQLMAEADGEADGDGVEPGLGSHDVKTGIYEGGFKSWESSVDLVKVLAAEDFPGSLTEGSYRIIELGCGTALPSLALFQWALSKRALMQKGLDQDQHSLCLTLADYNPSVLQLVTMPNFLLAWALHQQQHDELTKEALSSSEGELEITEHVIDAFKAFLDSSKISLCFISGGWSAEFVDLVNSSSAALPSGTGGGDSPQKTLIMGAETIYSPFALSTFTETLLSILSQERDAQPSRQAVAIVAAKRLYFGVGGSLDDFVDKMRNLGAAVSLMREETEGVRRGVVKCMLP